jgi:hypothetical protein
MLRSFYFIANADGQMDQRGLAGGHFSQRRQDDYRYPKKLHYIFRYSFALASATRIIDRLAPIQFIVGFFHVVFACAE